MKKSKERYKKNGVDAIRDVFCMVLRKLLSLVVLSGYGQSAIQTLLSTYSDGKPYQSDASKGWC
ncbi:hypothetical protein [Arcticibacter eurypsychrophilus]|uniref:hypothetical protein n=1 Tax=Arcticibacter eurypsychrophilus TaxID=1434752 RepID=UPI001112EFDF|nr:hypothetical protein [Arcticibacter eurypsychrophilus]